MEQLSGQKTGALIVLERDIGLRTFIESGVRLEARISRLKKSHNPWQRVLFEVYVDSGR